MPARRSSPPGTTTNDPKVTEPPTPKLRDSCDPCASSKLKCSKEKPTCARCAKRGITCEYVATKRGGRKPINRASISESRASSGANSAKSTRPNTPPASIDTTQSPTPGTIFAPSSTDVDIDLSSPSLIHGSPLPVGSAGTDYTGIFSPTDTGLFSACPTDISTDGMEDIIPTPLPFNMSSAPGVDMLAQKNVASSNVMDSTSLMKFDSLFDTVPAFDDTMFGNLGFQTPSSLVNNCTDPNEGDMTSPQDLIDTQCSCLMRALKLMGQLFQQTPSACMLFTSQNLMKEPAPQPPPIEVVISENEAAVEAVGEMLRCPCSHDGYLLTIMSLIVSKVLGRYAVGGHNAVYPSSNNSSQQSLPSLGRTRSASSISWPGTHVDSPITGTFGFDGDHSARMAAQLVLSKLHHVRHIVNELSPKLRAQAARNAGRSSPLDSVDYLANEDVELASPLSGVMLDQLDIDLRTKLKMVSSQVLEGLRRL